MTTEIDINYEDVCIGDYITVHFCPDSQKYIDDLYPISGRVVEKPERFVEMRLEDAEGNRYSAFHNSVHFFGMTLGYSWWITKLVLPSSGSGGAEVQLS